MQQQDSRSSGGHLVSPWKGTGNTVYGNLACILHMVVVALLLVSSLYSVFVPASEGADCALKPFYDATDGDPYVARYLSGLIQLLNWWGVGFFAQSFGCSMKNAVLLMTLLVGAWYINFSMTDSLLEMDPEKVTVECFSGLVLFVVVVCTAEGVVVLLLGCDLYSRRSQSMPVSNDDNVSTPTTSGQHAGLETEKMPLVPASAY